MKLSAKEYQYYLAALIRIDRALDKLHQVDTVYGDMVQNFEDAYRTRIPHSLMKLIRKDRKRSAK